jgi:ATP sulfurylase
VDEYDKSHPDVQDVKDREKTSLRGAIQIFEKTFWKGMCDTIRTNMRDKADRIAADTVDF